MRGLPNRLRTSEKGRLFGFLLCASVSLWFMVSWARRTIEAQGH